MSKKRAAKPVLLGPDGKPLDRAKYAQKQADPEPTDLTRVAAFAGVDWAVKEPSDHYMYFAGDAIRSFTVEMSLDIAGSKAGSRAKETLRSAVTRQLDSLTREFEGAATTPELPVPEPDLHTYRDAYASAVKKCPHTNVEDTIHSQGQFFCVDCRRYLSREDMQKRDSGRSWFFR